MIHFSQKAWVIFFCFTAADLAAQNKLRDIPPPDPNIELASFKVPEGFEVNLWASDPLLAKPTQITFDREGRLWASSSETYPQLNVNQDPTDRIVILQDTNHDGVADQSSVYYDKLLIPGGVLPDGQGGAYVAHAKELLHLQDTNKDGKADKKQVVLSGFGTEDTHHTLHRLRWGPDGLMYMLQGYYIGTHVETMYGPRRLNGGGLWSYDTRTRRLEVYSRGLVNPWGVRFDRWGQTFQTDGAGGEGINYSFPDSVFKASPHENRILRGLNPERPKLCGLEVISGRHFPESWAGSLVAADFRANNIDRFTLKEKDSGYASLQQDDLLQSTHVSFRPIDMVMGPDGALYIADWYSPIIQHGEVDFRDERRDHVHGRIWRIAAKGRPLVQPINYRVASIAELLDLLKSKEDWVRLNVKQELKRRDEDAVEAAISKWLPTLNPDDPEFEHHRLEALWTYQTISTKRSPELVHDLLDSPDHRVRAAAVRVLYHWHDDPQKLADAISDPHPRVRREAVTALGQYRSEEAARIALTVLDHPMDEFLDFALWRTCRILEPFWLPAFQSNEFTFNGNADRLAFALKAIEKPEALAPLIEMLKVGREAADPAIVRLIGKIGTAEHLDILLPIASVKEHPLAVYAAMALVEATEDRGLSPDNSAKKTAACRALLANSETDVVAAACRLIGGWKSDGKNQHDFEEALVTHLSSDSKTLRQAAAQGLAGLGSHRRLKTASLESDKISSRVSAAAALTRIAPELGVNSAYQLLREELAESEVEELMDSVLTKKGASDYFANAMKNGKINSQNALYASRLVETSAVQHAAEIILRLAIAGDLNTSARLPREEQLAQLFARLSDGDRSRGAEIFHREKMTCVKCHSVKGKGGDIGPDLSSIGAAAPVDYLIESLLEPNKKIKEGYRMTIVATEDGDVFAGSVVREDDNVVVLRNAVGNESRVPKSVIESRDTSPVSMMPSGLTASLSEDEFLDLVAYLASLGKQ